MNILSIESSCDETAAAILSGGPQDFAAPKSLKSNVIVSQIDIFAAYGGVIPEIAARSHLEAILPVIHRAFADADFQTPDGQDDWSKIDAISVTHTPGLLGSLLIGTLAARTLAILHDKPFYPVHHLKSHIYSAWLTPDITGSSVVKNITPTSPEFPLLALVVSGGHTQIIRMSSPNDFEIIGTTRDDAVGECFDKIAKILGLPYPGGPAISNAALGNLSFCPELTEKFAAKSLQVTPGDRHKYRFPHPKVAGLDFSFSGLKTAVLRAVQSELGLPISHPSHDLKTHLTPEQIADFAASFEETAVAILLEKLRLALRVHPDTRSIVLAGGVSANHLLRTRAEKTFSTPVFFPDLKFAGDNAAMVAMATLAEITSGKSPSDPYSLNLLPRSPIE